MSKENSTLGNAGSGTPIHALGKEYALFPLTGKVRGAFSAWLEVGARNDVMSEPPSARREGWDSFHRRKNRHEFEWGSPFCFERLRDNDGILYMLYLLTVQGEPERDLKEREAAILELKTAWEAEDEAFSLALKEILKNAGLLAAEANGASR